MSFKVKFLPYNKEVILDDSTSLMRCAVKAGIHINASCGGQGSCGKCKVLIEKGKVEKGKSEHLSIEDKNKGYRLACISTINSDAVIRIPVESALDSYRLDKPQHVAQAIYEDVEQLKQGDLFDCPVKKIYLELEPASPKDNQPDLTRIINHLRLKHNEHRLFVDLELIRKIPDLIRNSDFKVTVTIVRSVREDGKNEIINIEPFDTTNKNFAIAIDIGTTTIYGQLIDLNNGKTLFEHGEFNSQISYGEDVISRIVFSQKSNGCEILGQKVIQTINKIVGTLLTKTKIKKHEVTSVFLAGNSTMTQLLLQINPKYIRLDPYVPASVFYPPFRAAQIGIELFCHTIALIYPCVSSYVGGDIISGLIASKMYKSNELTLYMDIGTNAEIVIGNCDWMVCTAASAGPAFEGGGIKFGMRATEGAIEVFSINPITHEPMIITIGDKKAKGICGSGLIAISAALLEAGIIDSKGKFNQNLDTTRIRKTDDVLEYVIVYKENTIIDKDITITESDLDNLIRAKAAMYSAAITLLDEVGLKINDIEKIVLAGGFGSCVDLEAAITIGLLPEIDHKKVIYLGNGSLLGCKINSLNNEIRSDVLKVVNMMTNFELASTPSYMENYYSALFLPHTQLDYFPKVNKRLEKLYNQKV